MNGHHHGIQRSVSLAKSGGMGDVVGALTKYLPNNDFSIKLLPPIRHF